MSGRQPRKPPSTLNDYLHGALFMAGEKELQLSQYKKANACLEERLQSLDFGYQDWKKSEAHKQRQKREAPTEILKFQLIFLETTNKVMIRWEEPQDCGMSPIMRYEIRHREVYQETLTGRHRWSKPEFTEECEYILENLVGHKFYQINVCPVNRNHRGQIYISKAFCPAQHFESEEDSNDDYPYDDDDDETGGGGGGGGGEGGGGGGGKSFADLLKMDKNFTNSNRSGEFNASSRSTCDPCTMPVETLRRPFSDPEPGNNPLSQYHEMFSGPKPMICVSHEQVGINEELLACEILDNISLTLRYEAAERGLGGFLPPSLVAAYGNERVFVPPDLRVPQNQNGANLHNVSNVHYVVSLKEVLDGDIRITIFDSLIPAEGQNANPALLTQLEALYGSETIDAASIRIVCAQSQNINSNDCALFALANIQSLLNGIDPCDLQFDPQMRTQLRSMLQNGEIRQFQSRRRLRPMAYDPDGYLGILPEEQRVCIGRILPETTSLNCTSNAQSSNCDASPNSINDGDISQSSIFFGSGPDAVAMQNSTSNDSVLENSTSDIMDITESDLNDEDKSQSGKTMEHNAQSGQHVRNDNDDEEDDKADDKNDVEDDDNDEDDDDDDDDD